MILFYCAAINLILTKYFSIYHGPFLALFDEGKLLRKMKLSSAILSLILVTVQYSYSTDFDNLADFQIKFYGHYKPDAATPLIHVRIEFSNGLLAKMEKCFKNPKSCMRNCHSNNDIMFGYNVRVIQLVIFSLISTMVVVIVRVPSVWSELYIVTMISVFLPYLIILKHDGMTKTAAKILRNIFVEPLIYLVL